MYKRQEIELTLFIEKFNRTGTNVIDLCHGIGANLADTCAFFCADCWAGSLLEDFLVAALQRAISLAQMHREVFAVAEHLNFDMARCGEVFFDIDFVIAKGRLALRAGGAEGRWHFLSGICHFHPASTTAGSGFDDDGVAELFSDF